MITKVTAIQAIEEFGDVRETAERWGYSCQHVRLLCTEGKIIAKRSASGWIIYQPSVLWYQMNRGA